MILVISVLLFVCTGCASIINGPDQKVTIVSEPAGADIAINGQAAGTTPATFWLVRKKDHVISLAKEGYHVETVDLKRKLSAVAILYLLPGGLVSFGVDSTQGAQFSFQDKVESKLKPLFNPQKVIASHLNVLKGVKKPEQSARVQG